MCILVQHKNIFSRCRKQHPQVHGSCKAIPNCAKYYLHAFDVYKLIKPNLNYKSDRKLYFLIKFSWYSSNCSQLHGVK